MAGSGSKKTQFPIRRATANARARQQLTQMLNARRELKYYAVTYANNTASAGDTIGLTQTIIQGDSSEQRDGASIQLKHFETRARFWIDSANSYDAVRIIHFIDRFNAGTRPAVLDILESAVVQSVYTRDVVVTKRYQILDDSTRMLADDASNFNVEFIIRKKLKVHKCFYNGTASADASNGRGALFVLIIANNNSNPSNYAAQTGLCYYDS